MCLSSRPPLKLEEHFCLVLALLQVVIEEAGHGGQLAMAALMMSGLQSLPYSAPCNSLYTVSRSCSVVLGLLTAAGGLVYHLVGRVSAGFVCILFKLFAESIFLLWVSAELMCLLGKWCGTHC